MKSKFYSFPRLLFAIALILINLPAESSADAQATLQWDPIDNTFVGYRLYHRTEGESYNYNQFIDTGNTATHTVYGLEENTTYYFVVRAYAGSQVSPDSNEVAFHSDGATTSDTNLPGQPHAVQPEYNATDVPLQAMLQASAYYDPDGDDHTESRWRIYRMDNDNLVLDLISSDHLTELTVPAYTLSHFTAYYWTVSYTNQNGASSPPSPRSYFSTIEDQAPNPSTSSNLGGGDGGGDSIGGAGCFIGSTR